MPLIFLIALLAFSSCIESTQSSTPEDHTSYSSYENDSVLQGTKPWLEVRSLEQLILESRTEARSLLLEGENEQALQILDEIISIARGSVVSNEEHTSLGRTYTLRAYTHNNIFGDFLTAKDDYSDALAHFDSASFEDFIVARHVLQPLGNIHTRLAENEQAIQLLQQFLKMSLAANDSQALLDAYNDLAKAHLNKGDYQEALSLLNEGISKAVGGVDNLGLLYLSKAEVHIELHDFENGFEAGHEGKLLLTEALNAVDSTHYRYTTLNQYLVDIDIILGRLAIKRNEPSRALSRFQKAIISAREFYPAKHRMISKCHIGLAEAQALSGNYEDAINSYQLALISSIPSFNESDFQVNPGEELLYADVVIGEAFLGKAQTAKQLFVETKDKEWLALAAETYVSYFQWDNLLRAEQQHDKSKLDFVAEIHIAGEKALNVLFELHQLDPNAGWEKVAFEILEQTKGVVLAESRFASFQKLPQAQADKDIEAFNKIKSLLSLLQIQLNAATVDSDSTEVKRLNSKIAVLSQKGEILQAKISERYQNYSFETSQEHNAVEVETTLSYLKKKQCDLISYFVGHSKMYVIAIHNGKLFFRELERDLGLSIVDQLLDNLRNPDTGTAEEYAALSNQVFEALLGDLPSKLTNNRWLVLPDGRLNSLPFEALTTEIPVESIGYKALPYLVKKHSICYSPSLKFVLQQERDSIASKPFLGVAPIFENSQTHAYLKDSEEEVSIGKNAFGGELLLREHATKEQFLKKVSDFQIVHISTHAGSGTGVDNDAWMTLYPTGEKTSSELLAPELFQITLGTELIILNACETGDGTYYSGEGVLSMARGFADAGATSVITNLWQVSHVANAKILAHFYDTLGASKPPFDALSLAKIAYLDDEDTEDALAHPSYWSAPVLIGANAQIDIETDEGISTTTSTIIVILLIIACYFLFRRFFQKPL